MSRDELRNACLARLDERAIEHPSGHQGKLAARYLMWRSDGDAAELMFEKGPKSPPKLWVAERFVDGMLPDEALEFRHSPAAALFTVNGKDGKPVYGRHSALKPMKQLAHTDLICFRINTLGDLEKILEHVGKQ